MGMEGAMQEDGLLRMNRSWHGVGGWRAKGRLLGRVCMQEQGATGHRPCAKKEPRGWEQALRWWASHWRSRPTVGFV